MIILGKPEPDSMIDCLHNAIARIKNKEFEQSKKNYNVYDMYNWRDIADRTIVVYNEIYNKRIKYIINDKNGVKRYKSNLLKRIKKQSRKSGPYASIIMIVVLVVYNLLLLILNVF